MLLTDPQAAELKKWVMKELDAISDADPDILADYAIALVRADAPEQSLKENTLDQLRDFLGPIAERFVSDLFAELNKRSYAESQEISDHSTTTRVSHTAHTKRETGALDVSRIHPSRSGHISIGPTSSGTASSNQSKKRTWQDSQDLIDAPNGPRRPVKQTRRAGARSTTHVTGDGNGFNRLHPLHDSGTAVARPMFDTQVAQGQLPGMDMQLFANFMSMMQGIELYQCPDYFGKGRCERGQACPFNHGTNAILLPSNEYDPKNPHATISVSTSAMNTASHQTGNRSRTNGRAKTGRAAFSMLGPSFDQSNTTIVVEQIPEDNFEEEQVRSHFEQFGPIEEINMQAYKRLALVTFSDHASAQSAWDSPKVIFDNRFVKVYWYNPDTIPTSSSNGATKAVSTEPEFDRSKFEQENAEAQRKHEARLKAREETQTKVREIEERKATLAKEQLALIEQLRARGVEPYATSETLSNGKKKHHDTEALKAQLAALEEEARGMGIDPDAMEEESASQGKVFAPRGRGGYRGGSFYRGRGAYRGRGNTWPARGAHRGAHRGGSTTKGPYRGQIQAGGRYNLDLRPKSVKVTLEDEDATWTEKRDEILREHVFRLGEFERIEVISGEDDEAADNSIVVVFKDRTTAEELYFGPRYIQGLGKLAFEWAANPPGHVTQDAAANGGDDGREDDGDGDTAMGNAPADRFSGATTSQRRSRTGRGVESDDEYDVAEEDERWVVK